ncbi:rifin [Plasmodium sp. gorilla clade G1]|nr:rifin [Plasmodium sp. gorilla clade G1]
MKILYTDILLFALPLNILEHNQRNHNSTTYHTTKPKRTKTHRSLCECDLYMPNYENDPQMKKVIQQFEDLTSQRFHEYDERMKTTRQKCREQCDKEIQKIILKDKLEKELTQKFATLQTDIQNDAIPTCICEKSIADKMEKTCLKCTQNFGGIVAPSSGVLAGIAEGALSVWKPAALDAAKAAALIEATDAATQAGMKAVISKIEELNTFHRLENGFVDLSSIVSKLTYNNSDALVDSAKKLFLESGKLEGLDRMPAFYNTVIDYPGPSNIEGFGKIGSDAYHAAFTSQKGTLEATKAGAVDATYGACQNAITASVITIVVIILIMVIIYLILRYRRKKKMKKKLQYIKLLEE